MISFTVRSDSMGRRNVGIGLGMRAGSGELGAKKTEQQRE